jgi:ABC-type multidrug transport system fused ATPase/permease subunit
MSDVEAWRNALWMVYKDNHEYVRHHEVQRSTVATLIVTVAGAALAVATFDQMLSPIDAPLLAVVTVLGIFGSFFSRKQFERTRMHIERADALLREIAETLGGQEIVNVTNRADREHSRKFRNLYIVPVNRLWAWFYGFISMLGALLLVLALVQPFLQPAAG